MEVSGREEIKNKSGKVDVEQEYKLSVILKTLAR